MHGGVYSIILGTQPGMIAARRSKTLFA